LSERSKVSTITDTDTFEKLASDIMDAAQIVHKRVGISEDHDTDHPIRD
jgi:hypothetical protein